MATALLLTIQFVLSAGIEIDRRVCVNDINCGAEFNDISGKLHELVEFEVEYLLSGAAFNGATWVPDYRYPNNGYLLFTVSGPAEDRGLYKLIEDGDDLYVETLFLINVGDVTWSEATPNYVYLASFILQQIIVFNLETNKVKKTYDTFEGLKFAGPLAITSDDDGNIYFTDSDLNLFDPPDGTRAGGSLFRINVLRDEIVLEGTTEYGFDGIALNNLYGNGKRLVAANPIDLPGDEWAVRNNDIWDPHRLFIAEYFDKSDGSLKDRGRYYSITEHIELFPQKPYLGRMTFDVNDNLFFAVITNQTMSKLSVINYNDCSDLTDGDTDYIGEINFADDGFEIYAITLADDGYFYGSLLNYPSFRDGEFVRIKARNFHKRSNKHKKNKKKKKKNKRRHWYY